MVCESKKDIYLINDQSEENVSGEKMKFLSASELFQTG